MLKFSSFLLFLLFFHFISCDTSDYINTSNMTDRLPIGIAKDFEMTYTDSMKIKSLINAPTHKDFSNHRINYSEFVDGIKVTLFDEDRTTTITSDYAILYNRFRLIDFKGNVVIISSLGESLFSDQLYFDTENEWLFTEGSFRYIDDNNNIIANRLDSNREFSDLLTGSLVGSINVSDND